MMNDYKNLIWEISTRLRNVTFSRDYVLSTLRILFLKYSIDNCIGAVTADDMQACVKAQKMFALRDTANGIDAVIPVLEYLDRAYGLDHILSGAETIEAYGRDLFGFDASRKKRNASDKSFQMLLEYIGGLDLEENTSLPLGQALADAILSEMTSASMRNSLYGEYVTPHSVSKFAKELLRVRSDDTFVDFASGIGSSSLVICGDAKPRIMNAEINRVNAASAAMLYILYGFKSIHVVCADSLSDPIPDLCGNKLFVEPPFSAKLTRSETSKYSDSSLAALSGIIDNYLTKPGDAVMVCQGSLLFQSRPQTVSLRERLIEGGMLRAVITLPTLTSYSTGITVHLLVIGKADTIAQSDVLFIDLAREMKGNRYRNAQRDGIIPDELIEKVVSCVDDPMVIPGFSCVVSCDSIRENQYNLVPASYLPPEDEEDDITIDEINEQLKDLYELLLQNQ